MAETSVLTDIALRPASPADLDAVLDLFNICGRALYGTDRYTREELKAEWETPGFELEESAKVAVTPDGRIVGYVDVYAQAPYVSNFTWLRVHPTYQDGELGERLLRWAEERAGHLLPLAPEGARVELRSHVHEKSDGARAVFQARGFEAIRYAWTMEIEFDAEPPEPIWPDGITVRPMQPGEERAVFAAVRDSFRDHFGYVERPFDEAFKRWQHHIFESPNHDPGLLFVALAGDEIAGMALNWPTTTEDPEMGWVDTLGVRRAYRRRGLGLALLRHSFRAFHERGLKRAGLGVDAESLTGATRLYEKAGMRPTHTYLLYEKELRPGADFSRQTAD